MGATLCGREPDVISITRMSQNNGCPVPAQPTLDYIFQKLWGIPRHWTSSWPDWGSAKPWPRELGTKKAALGPGLLLVSLEMKLLFLFENRWSIFWTLQKRMAMCKVKTETISAQARRKNHARRQASTSISLGVDEWNEACTCAHVQESSLLA